MKDQVFTNYTYIIQAYMIGTIAGILALVYQVNLVSLRLILDHQNPQCQNYSATLTSARVPLPVCLYGLYALKLLVIVL